MKDADFKLTIDIEQNRWGKKSKKAPVGFELTISCLLDRRFNQLSHGATDECLSIISP